MNSFKLNFRRFERHPQSDQLFIIFTHSIELIFLTLETALIDMNPLHSMIDPIVNKNFGNKFHHQNGPNQRQHTKNISASNTITSPLDNSISTETLVNNVSIDILVNNINQDHPKDIEHLQSHTWKKMVLDLDSTSNVWENCSCKMMEHYKIAPSEDYCTYICTMCA